jgi:hypothetical protein
MIGDIYDKNNVIWYYAERIRRNVTGGFDARSLRAFGLEEPRKLGCSILILDNSKVLEGASVLVILVIPVPMPLSCTCSPS